MEFLHFGSIKTASLKKEYLQYSLFFINLDVSLDISDFGQKIGFWNVLISNKSCPIHLFLNHSFDYTFVNICEKWSVLTVGELRVLQH